MQSIVSCPSTRTNNRGFYGVFGGTGPQGVVSATEGAYWQNTYDPEAEWGPAFHDVRHNLVLSATYELPFGAGKRWGTDWNGVINAIAGGWRLGGIFQARSGLPVTVTDGRARSLQGERGAERPNCVGDWKPSDQSIDHWLDINGFQAVPLGTFGNCPVGVARGPRERPIFSGRAIRARILAVSVHGFLSHISPRSGLASSTLPRR